MLHKRLGAMLGAREARLAVSFFVLASAAILLTRLNGGVALLWVANAPLLAHLCRSSPRQWRAALLWAVPASIAASALFGPVLWAAPFLAIASVLEAALAAALLRRLLRDCDYFKASGSVVVFSAVAGLLAPAISGLIGATMAWAAFARPWGPTYVDWVIGHGLGTLIASPIVALVLDRDRRSWNWRMLTRPPAEGAALLLGVAVTTAAVFLQNGLPLLFLPALPILLATFKLGRPGAALSIVMVAVIGWIATANGHGPVTMTHLSPPSQFQFFQLYLAATFLMSLPMAGALGQREQLLHALENSEARHRRIVERSQDVIFETDAHGGWTFLSEAWTRLTGREVADSLGQRANLAIPGEDWSKLEAVLRDARAAPGAIGQTEVRFVGTGGVRWAAVTIGMLCDAAGRVTGSYGTISDVTERKRAEADIAESERRYGMLADNASDMIAQVGLDGCFRSVTPACRELVGLEPEALLGKPCTDLIVAEDVPAVVAAYTALLKGAPDQAISYRHLRPSGDPLWVEGVFRLIRDEHERPREFIVSVRDNSRRKLLEAETAAALQRVRESNRLFGMAGALASIGHWRFSIDSGSVIWSDEVFRIHGLPLGAPPPLADAMTFYHPDDRAQVQTLLDEAIAAQRSFEFGARIVRADGSVRHVISQGRGEFDDAGRMVGMFGVFQDVTERALAEETLRNSEARFRLITEQASDIIALIDLEGVCLFMSPASATILGVPPEQMIGSKPIERIHEDDREVVDAYRTRLYDTPSAQSSSVRFRMRRADGAFAWLEASSRLAEVADRPCIVAVWRDVSQQVAIEAELKAAKAEAEAASAAKAGFLANMSHEIRTPMNGVIGFAELLLASDLLPEQRRDAGLIADSGKAMMKLLNDILDLSKIEAGQLDVVAESFDLPHALRACGKLLRPSAEQKRLGFLVSVADDVPRFVLGDGLRVRQIVLNLLGNAIKFTEHGWVSLSLNLVDYEGPWLAIRVSDTGIGIAPERQASIFEDFVQADHSITRRYGGTGLGLAISNRLAALMGGRLVLESNAGEGTTVTLLLPAAIPADRAAPVAGVVDLPTVVGRPCRVLLAEDHEVNQLLVRAMLSRGGHEVVLVEDGQAAVDAVRESMEQGTPYDVVLMDMQMPVMDGLAATRAIRLLEGGSGRRLPVVALTANAFASDLESCREAGMDDHVAKPVSMDTLLAAVDRWSRAAAAPPAPPAPRAAFRPGAAAQSKYAEHRARTLEHVDMLVRRGTFTDEELHAAAELLHKLAGTAGMFGEAALGDRASALEEEMLAWPPAERAALAVAAAASLRDAA